MCLDWTPLVCLEILREGSGFSHERERERERERVCVFVFRQEGVEKGVSVTGILFGTSKSLT